MTYSTDSHLAEEDEGLFEHHDRSWARKHERAGEDLVRDLRRHGYLEAPADAFVDASARATAELVFTAATGAAATVPAGTLVRSSDPASHPTHGAVVFATDAELELEAGASGSVSATALDFGRPGNVPAGALVHLVEPVAGVDSVAQPAAASGGADHQLTRAAVYRVMELVMLDLLRMPDDAFDHRRRLYAKMYAAELERVMAAGLDVDADGDGAASEAESDLLGHGFHRFGRG